MSRPLIKREVAERLRDVSSPNGEIYHLALSYLALLDGRETIPTIDPEEWERAIEDFAA